MLPFLDRLFGTWYLPDRQWPAEYGVEPGVESGEAAGALPAGHF